MKMVHPYAIAWIEMACPGLSNGSRIIYNFIGFQHPLTPGMLHRGGNEMAYLALYYFDIDRVFGNG